MNTECIDLHVHSTESDGTLTPTELVTAAKEAGLIAFALTDHDTCQGVQKAQDAAKDAGIELIPGIELSTDYHGKEVHIVGLYVDPHNELHSSPDNGISKMPQHAHAKIVEALQREELSITMEALEAENPDCVITRANIARFLYEHGQVNSVKEAFDRYIGDHCKCYVGRFKVASTDAIALIHAAGGTAILAHPILYGLGDTALEKLVTELTAAGLDGIEALYSTYTKQDEMQIKEPPHSIICCLAAVPTSTVPTNRISGLEPDVAVSIFLILILTAIKEAAQRTLISLLCGCAGITHAPE